MSDNPQVVFNQRQTDPTLMDLLNLQKKQILLAMNCHALATIQSFDKDAQTVTATINYKKSFLQAGADGTYSPVLVDYPILIDIPIIMLFGGMAKLTFPIQAGDTCLVLFNDRDMDNWFQSGQIGGVASGRLHSFSDGIALVGLRSQANVFDSYQDDHAGLSWAEVQVMISESKVLIQNAAGTLKDVINGLIDIIKSVQTIPAVPGSPLTLDPTSIAQLETYKATVGGLLE